MSVAQPASALAAWPAASQRQAAKGQLAHPSTGTCARCHSQTRTRPSLASVTTRKASALPLCRAASSVLYCQRMAVTGSLQKDLPILLGQPVCALWEGSLSARGLHWPPSVACMRSHRLWVIKFCVALAMATVFGQLHMLCHHVSDTR